MDKNMKLAKEAMKQRIREAMYKSVKDIDNSAEKFLGRKPKTLKSRINQIYRIVHKYGLDSKLYSDEAWQAIDDYHSVISSLGCDVDIFPCANLNRFDSDITSDGGYTDYDPQDHMPRSKQYKIVITFEDGMKAEGYIKCMAAGTVSDPFSKYDTCMVLWPKQGRGLSDDLATNESRKIKLTVEQLERVINESVKQTIKRIK